jgi:hypothetical protein
VSAQDAAEAASWFHSFAFGWYLSPPLFLVFSLLLSDVRIPPLAAALIFLPGFAVLIAHSLDPNAVLASVDPISLGGILIIRRARIALVQCLQLQFMRAHGHRCAGLGDAHRPDRRIRVRAAIVLFSIVPAFSGLS